MNTALLLFILGEVISSNIKGEILLIILELSVTFYCINISKFSFINFQPPPELSLKKDSTYLLLCFEKTVEIYICNHL